MKKENRTLKKRKGVGRIIIPPRYIKVKSPVIFLAGPIRGAENWQDAAIDYIKSKKSKLHIASPRRAELNQEDFQEDIFDEQVDWEHYYLQRAGKNGVILFWLAKETEHKCNRAYAQTTRFELGEAAAKHHFSGIKIVVGIEEGFVGAKYIKKTLSKKYPKIPIANTLEKTCDLAIKLAAQ